MGGSKSAVEQQAADTPLDAGQLSQADRKHSTMQQKGHSNLATPAEPAQQPDAAEADTAEDEQQKQVQKKRKKQLSEEKLRRLKEQHDNRGVVYISRLPPHMKPGKLRQLLSQHGEIGRIYCTPEDQAMRQQRKKKGGNSGKNFTEGWVEFEDKSIAKSAAATLNGQQIGGKRRSAYHFDLWCMKYLPKFKWDHLTEEINYEKAIREQRMAHQLASAKRERDFYLSRVDKAKAQAAMAERRQKTQQQGNGNGPGDAAIVVAKDVEAAAAIGTGQHGLAAAAAAAAGGGGGVKRMYGQRKAKADPSRQGAAEIGEDVLGLIVAKKQKHSHSSLASVST